MYSNHRAESQHAHALDEATHNNFNTAHAQYMDAVASLGTLAEHDADGYIQLAHILRDAGWAHFRHHLLPNLLDEDRIRHARLGALLLNASWGITNSRFVENAVIDSGHVGLLDKLYAEHGATLSLKARREAWLEAAGFGNTGATALYEQAAAYHKHANNRYYEVSNDSNYAKYLAWQRRSLNAARWSIRAAYHTAEAWFDDQDNFKPALRTLGRQALAISVGGVVARRSILRHP